MNPGDHAARLEPAREQAMLVVLMLVQFTVIVDFMIMMPLSSYLMQEFGIGTSQFGLLVSAYAFGAAASAILAASIADRFDRRRALLANYAGLLFATLACAMATGFYSLLVARTIAGIFGGVLGSISFAIVGDLIPPLRRGRAMSTVMLGFSLSAVAGVPAGLLLAAHWGWRSPFIVLSLACVGAWLAARRVVPPVRGHLGGEQPGFFASYRELLSVRNHWWAFAVTTLTMFAGFLVIPYIAPSLIANVGLKPTDLVYIYLVGGAVTLFSRPLVGRLTDRYRHADVLAVCVLLSYIPILLMTHSLQVPLAGQLLLAALFFGLVSSRFIPASALATGATLPRLRGRMMAFNAAMQNLGSGTAAFVAGSIMSTGPAGELIHYERVGYLSCVAGLLVIAVSRRVRPVS